MDSVRVADDKGTVSPLSIVPQHEKARLRPLVGFGASIITFTKPTPVGVKHASASRLLLELLGLGVRTNHLPDKLRLQAKDSLLDDVPPPPGLRDRPRKKGSAREKRSIGKIRRALGSMLERNASQFDAWFVQAAEKDPIKALVLMKDLLEYFTPKLGRIEQTGTVEHKVQHFVPLIAREEPPEVRLEPPKDLRVIEGESSEVLSK